MSIPRNRPRPSCLARFFSGFVQIVINVLISGVAAAVLLWLYPALTPPVIALFESLNTPPSGYWWGGFWLILSFLLGAIVAGGLTTLLALLTRRKTA